MGKGIKRALIAAGILFVLGIALCTVAVAAGVNVANVTFFRYDKGEMISFDQTYTEKIDSIDIDFEAGELKVVEGEQFRVEAQNVPKKAFSVTVDNGTLKVKENASHWWHLNFGWIFGDNEEEYDSVITVYVPAATTLEKFELDMSAGKGTINNIKAEEAKVDMSAGKLDITAFTISKETKLKMSAGVMNVNKSELKDCDMHLSAGSLYIEGTLTGDSSASCSAGSIAIETSLTEDMYDYDADVSAGSIEINGEKITNNHNKINNSASNRFELDCSAGKITVKTK